MLGRTEAIRPVSPVSERVSRNPAVVYLSGLAPSGRRSVGGRLRKAARLLGYEDPRLFPWGGLRFEHVAAVRAALVADRVAPATINAVLSALKGVAQAAFQLGLLPADELQRIKLVRGVRGEALLRGRALSAEELRRLEAICRADASPRGLRDLVVLHLLAMAGLRRAEAVGLQLEDVQDGALIVRGKGNKARRVFLPKV